MRVSFNGQERNELVAKVGIVREPDADGQLRLKVTLNGADFRNHGQCRITGIVAAPSGQPAQFSFAMVRKPATLQVPANLKLRVDDTAVIPMEILVHETGSETGVLNLNARLDGVVNVASKSTATFAFADTKPLEPGHFAKLIPQPSGELPLVSSTSTLTLPAPELVSAVVVPVEITRRLSICWLLLALALGIVSSLVFRVILATRQTLDTARLAAAGALGISIHDHLVIGRKGHASFRSLGLI